MRITISGATVTPRWETLQQMIREATQDERAVLVRISRDDNGCNYRDVGTYTLGLRVEGSDVAATLEVTK